MNKDLFEQRIGESLRRSEAQPPAGAWDFIKASIPSASPAPPFKFPTWAIAVVSAALLGSMAMVGGSEDTGQTAATESSVEATYIAQEADMAEPIRTVSPQASLSEGETEKAETVSYVSPSESKQGQQEEVELNEPAEQIAENEAIETANLMAEEEAVSSNEASEGSLVEENLQEQKELETDQPNQKEEETVQEEILVKEYRIVGTEECYAPCTIALSANGNAEEYLWDAGIYGMFHGDELSFVIDEPQSLSIFGMAKYADGSEKAITRNILVKQGSQLFVPNSFTPNGDGINDTYEVSGTGIEEFSMTIINSKGKVVHQATDMANSWGMDAVSMDLDTEVYTAIIRARGIDGKEYSQNVRLTINP